MLKCVEDGYYAKFIVKDVGKIINLKIAIVE
jgi:hypothetical protein